MHRLRPIDEKLLRAPFYGLPNMNAYPRRPGYAISPNQVRRLIRPVGMQTVYPKQKPGPPRKGHGRNPRLLPCLPVPNGNQVWRARLICADAP